MNNDKKEKISATKFLKENILDNSYYTLEKKDKSEYIIKNKGQKIYLDGGKKGNNACGKMVEFLKDTEKKLNEKLKNLKEHLITFGEEFEFSEDSTFMEVKGSKKEQNVTEIRDFELKTGNIIGYIKRKFDGSQYELRINSRFGNKFLRYLISSSEGFLELEDFGGDSREKENFILWLLIYLWNIKLKKAYAISGIPKLYVRKTEELSRIRGSIDIPEYSKYLYEKAKYPCNYHEHSYNNPVNQLIALTFQQLYKIKRRKKEVLSSETTNLKNIFTCICDYKKLDLRNLDKIGLNNPFYKEFNEVAKLSKMILRQECSNILPEKSDFSAFLFDVSMLFEHYIRKLLKKKGFNVKEKEKKHWVPTGGEQNEGKRKLEPDVVIEGNEGLHIYDVKYKRFDFEYGIKREDIFQLISYVSIYLKDRNIKSCGFILPVKSERIKGDKEAYISRKPLELKSGEIDFNIFLLEIPKDAKGFKEKMEKIEEDFIGKLKKHT